MGGGAVAPSGPEGKALGGKLPYRSVGPGNAQADGSRKSTAASRWQTLPPMANNWRGSNS